MMDYQEAWNAKFGPGGTHEHRRRSTEVMEALSCAGKIPAMKKGDIRLSETHGVNPAIPLCYFCNGPKNEVILAGRLPGDQEAPRAAVWDKVPCDKCKGFMTKGIILISVKNGEEGDNPHRTGGWVVVTEDFIKRVLNGEVVEQIIKRRATFVPDEAWDRLGLPRGPVEGVPTE